MVLIVRLSIPFGPISQELNVVETANSVDIFCLGRVTDVRVFG